MIRSVRGVNKSAAGVAILDSTGTKNIHALQITDNTIYDIVSQTSARGAYGILINHADDGVSGATTGAIVKNNTIYNLMGGWAHAIGLEGNTPGALVEGNTFQNIQGNNNDSVGIMVEDNSGAGSVTIINNNLADVPIGVCNVTGTQVDAGENFWGSIAGPSNSQVYGDVNVAPWYANAGMTEWGIVLVDDDYDNSTPGWGSYAFDKIQDAIGSAIALGGTVQVAEGIYHESVDITKSLTLLGAGADEVTIEGLKTVGYTARFSANNIVLDGFKITRAGNNPLDWSGNANLVGITMNGKSGETVRNCIITGTRTAVDINNSSNITIANNVLTFNRTGMIMRNKTDNLTVTNNEISESWTMGILFLDASGGSNSPLQQALSSTLSQNKFKNNWYADIEDRQTGGSLPAPGDNPKNFFGNWFDDDQPTVDSTPSGEPGYAAQIPIEFGGTAEKPVSGFVNIRGIASANIQYSPWYEDESMTRLRYLDSPMAFSGEMIVGPGEEVTIPNVFTAGDGTDPGKAIVRVHGGTLHIGKLSLADHSVLEVIGGVLELNTAGGGSHSISGTFTIYNSFGSVYIHDDTDFNGDTLALISDIHVAAGKTLTVNGSLVFDGCTVNSQTAGSPFYIVVASGGDFAMVRSEVTDAHITLNGNAAEIRDNFLDQVAVTVNAAAQSNAIYHNIKVTPVALTDNGVGTITEVDLWGNIDVFNDTLNRLTLNLTTNGLPATRTRDSEGNLYIQPGDTMEVALDLTSLDQKVGGVEALLGFNTDVFDWNASAFETQSDWVYTNHYGLVADGVYGKMDTAVGLSVAYPDPVGTQDDSNVAKITLPSLGSAAEGLTKVYFRLKQTGDHLTDPAGKAWLFAFDGTNTYSYVPFTLNSGYVVLDGTPPEANIADFTGSQVQDLVPVDVFVPANLTRQGTATFTVKARDLLAGIDDDDVVLTLTQQNPPNITISNTLAQVSSPDVDGWVTYTFTATIDPTTPNGFYDAEFLIRDRSGNELALGPKVFEINKNQIHVTVELQGAVAGPFSRLVTFVATDVGGNVLKTWSARNIVFTNGVGTDLLTDVPNGVEGVSAKSEHHLRHKLSVSPDVNGQITADFTGMDLLLGGDLNGDNVVNTMDFNILRYYWYTNNAAADITGDNLSNVSDLNVLKANFYSTGSAE